MKNHEIDYIGPALICFLCIMPVLGIVLTGGDLLSNPQSYYLLPVALFLLAVAYCGMIGYQRNLWKDHD